MGKVSCSVGHGCFKRYQEIPSTKKSVGEFGSGWVIGLVSSVERIPWADRLVEVRVGRADPSAAPAILEPTLAPAT